MKYVALLRGINVGGNNKLSMKQLVEAMENSGFQNVSTYINSGNIFFIDNGAPDKLTVKLESLIKTNFNLNIKVLLRSEDNIKKVVAAIPKNWVNNSEIKCDVMFLWDEYANEQVLKELTIKPDIDEVRYIDGALIWRVDRDKVTRSGMMKLASSNLYLYMTIRNCNTARKLHERLSQMV